MKKHYQRAIQPLTVLAAIFGFALIEYPEGKPRRLLSLLCAIVSFTFQVALLGTKYMFQEAHHSGFLSWIRVTILSYVSLHILVFVCFGQLHGKRYQQCLDAINEIDETLRWLRIESDYSRLRGAVVVTLVAWMIYIIFLTACGTVTLSRGTNQIYLTIGLYVLNLPFHVPIIVDMCFWFVVGCAGTRFDCINNALKQFALDDKDYIGWVRNKKVISVRGVSILNEKNKRIIWTMMHLHFRLCDILCNITRLFESQLYMEIAMSFLILLYSMIFTCHLVLLPLETNNYKYCALIWAWMLLHFLKTFITNCICENVRVKAITVSDTAVRLIYVMDDEKMREDLLLIGLQTKQKPLRFSCLGLNNFGYQFLYAIVSTMASVTVIIVQVGTGLK